MTLIEQKEGWVPSKVHGEIPLLSGADPEITILNAINNLLPPQQRPAFRNIKYQIKPTTILVVPRRDKFVTRKIVDRTIFFELD